MEQLTGQEIVAALKKAKNLNAATKAFLKRQVNNGDAFQAKATKFVKELRPLLDLPDGTRAAKFIEERLEKYQNVMLALGAQAHQEIVDAIANTIVERHADEFNSTYSLERDRLVFQNEDRFWAIVDDVFSFIRAELNQRGFEGSPFMNAIVVHAIFEPAVLQEIIGPREPAIAAAID